MTTYRIGLALPSIAKHGFAISRLPTSRRLYGWSATSGCGSFKYWKIRNTEWRRASGVGEKVRAETKSVQRRRSGQNGRQRTGTHRCRAVPLGELKLACLRCHLHLSPPPPAKRPLPQQRTPGLSQSRLSSLHVPADVNRHQRER